jgi:uncharacterized protein YbcI
MTEHVTAAPEDALRTEITDALVAVWIRYAGRSPRDARTEIRDNVVTCVMIDAVDEYDSGLSAAEKRSAVSGASKLTDASYKSEAAARVADLMGRPVTSLISSHDHDTNAATETFTLERQLLS